MYFLLWPATAFLTIFVIVGVIIILLRFGPQICKTRHTALPDEHDWEAKAYEHPVSYEIA